MNVKLNIALLLVLAALLCRAAFNSPDGKVSCDFAVKDGVPTMSFAYAGTAIGEMTFAPGWKEQCQEIGSTGRTVRSSWRPVWGTADEYADNFTERIVRFSNPEAKGRETLRVELRTYDEGVAMRYVVTPNAYSENDMARDRFAVSFPAGSAAWPIPSTEATYPEEPLSVIGLDRAAEWRMPLTLRTPTGVYASIVEAYTVDWPRSYLVADGKGGFVGKFAHGTKCGRGEWTSPWRAVILSPTVGGLIERAHLVGNLNEPCKLEDVSWIRPGLSVADIGNCELKTDEVIEAGRAAKAIGAKYLQIDWGWYGTECPWSANELSHFRRMHPKLANDRTLDANVKADPFTAACGTVPYHPYWEQFDWLTKYDVELDIPRVVAELKKMDVGLCLYLHGQVLENVDLDLLFGTYEKWGVVGLKPGFVAYGSQRATDWLRNMAAVAAKHHLWLDIHDEHIPDGFERTWPNVFISEGGGGQEGRHPVRQDVAHPFARCLAAPFDYTPYFFDPNRTHAHAAAFLICYPGPTAVIRGNVAKAMSEDPRIFDFVRALPWTYDETRVLAGEMSKFIVVARRKGEYWFLGGMNGSSARTVRVPAGFLKTMTTFRLWTDSGEKTIVVGPKEFLEIKMSVGGGFVGLSMSKKDGDKPSGRAVDRDEQRFGRN